MNAGILSIGTELLRGEIPNGNATWLSERLTLLGCQVVAQVSVPDDSQRIEQSLNRLAGDVDVVVATGGLGPTTDDITRQCVARVLGESVRRDPESLVHIHERMARYARPVSASNELQADFPESAVVLPNEWGTAPGFRVRLGRAVAYFFPGVPRELYPMFERYTAPELSRSVQHTQHQVRIRCFGLGESTINDRLQGIEAEFSVSLAYRAHFPEIEVKVLGSGSHLDQAREAAELAANEVERRLDTVAYGRGSTGLPEVTIDALRQRGLTLSLAESCTGGLVASLLTRHSVSDLFLGGVVSYANSAKIELLGVDPALLEARGAVSREVAEAMARGGRDRFGSDVCLSLTGIAGPSGGTDAKPIGTVHLAVASPLQVQHQELHFPRERRQVQLYSAYQGLRLLLDVARSTT